jgi:iron complex transport system substrate-binding protein
VTKRIVSLLPSATEVLYFCGLGDQVVGVTYECNMPAEASSLPHVTNTIIPSGANPAEIDVIIGEAMRAGEQLYALDRDLLTSLEPDLIVTQDLCRVCALPAGEVDRAVAELGVDAEVFTYDPMDLDGVLDGMTLLASVAGARDSGLGRVDELRARLDVLRSAGASVHRPKVLLLEWPDPPYTPGHWIPDLITAAGGEALLAHPGGRSTATTWEEVAGCEAEILIVAPCGFDEAAAQTQLAEVLARPELANLPAVLSGRTYAIDADAYIVRPGPRLIEGVEVLSDLFAADRV